MSVGLTRAAMRRVVEGLAKLPPRAWLSVRTWERLVRGAARPGGRLSRVGPSARVVPRAEVMDVEVVDFLDCARSGVVVTGGRRYWVLPPRVVYDGAGVGRLVVLGAGVVWREGRLETAADEVPAVIAFMTPGGFWADETAPVWRAVPEADPDRDYPLSEVDAERVVVTLGVGPVTRAGPVFYARL
ncbi:MAG: hypothetical protein QE274_00345 [Verrucomicrobiaceae bacterium]|nr:hypothetical protein [Verrucomicrobiaceae bacterium]